MIRSFVMDFLSRAIYHLYFYLLLLQQQLLLLWMIMLLCWCKQRGSPFEQTNDDLVLANVTLNDSGIYTCYAASRLGHTQQTAWLTVIQQPIGNY